MAKLIFVVLLVHALGGCGFVDLTAPRIEGASFALVAFAPEEPPRVLIGESQAAAQNANFSSALADGSLDLVLLGYDQTTDELALPRGWVPLAAAEKGRTLPEPQRALLSSVRDQSQGPWQDAEQLPPESVRSLRIDAVAPPSKTCAARVDGEPVAIPNSEHWDASFAVGLSDGRALVSIRSNDDTSIRLYLVDRLGAEAVSMPPLVGPSSDGFADQDDRVWLILADGRYATWTSTSGLSPIRTSTLSFGRRIWLTHSGPEAPFELFAYGSLGHLARFDGARWQMVATRPVNDVDGLEVADLAWIAPGEVVVAGSGVPTAYHYQDGVGREEPLSTVAEVPIAMHHHAVRGTFVGTKLGRLFRRLDGHWLEQPAIGEEIRALGPFGCSLLSGDRLGALIEHVDDHTRCSSFPAVTGTVRAIVNAGAETAVVGDGDYGEIMVRFLAPARPEPLSCPP